MLSFKHHFTDYENANTMVQSDDDTAKYNMTFNMPHNEKVWVKKTFNSQKKACIHT